MDKQAAARIEPDELAGSMEIAFPADLLEPGRYALLLFSAERDLEERFEFEVRSSP